MSGETFSAEPPQGELNAFARFWVDVGRCTWRVASCNFQRIRVTDGEAKKLALSGITDPVGRSYASWRRSALWIAAIALFVHVIILFSTFRFMEYEIRREARRTQQTQLRELRKVYNSNPAGYEQQARFNPVVAAQIAALRNERKAVQEAEDNAVKQFGADNMKVVDALTLVGYSTVFIGSVLVLLGAAFWSNLRLSRLLSRIAWAVMFAAPLLIALIPVSAIFDFQRIEDPAARRAVVLTLGALAAVGVFVSEGSKVLAIFPGVIRSSMGLKTLLPESAVPGWIVALIAPLYVLVGALVLVTLNQLQGSWTLILAAVFLVLAPLSYIVFVKAVVRPHEAREIASVVNPVRLIAVACNVLGLIFLSIWVGQLELVKISTVFKFIFGLLANVLLLTVVVSDIVVQVLRVGYLQSRGFHEGQLRESLDRRFAGLAQIGRGRNELAPAPPPIPGNDGLLESSSGAAVDDTPAL